MTLNLLNHNPGPQIYPTKSPWLSFVVRMRSALKLHIHTHQPNDIIKLILNTQAIATVLVSERSVPHSLKGSSNDLSESHPSPDPNRQYEQHNCPATELEPRLQGKGKGYRAQPQPLDTMVLSKQIQNYCKAKGNAGSGFCWDFVYGLCKIEVIRGACGFAHVVVLSFCKFNME